MSLDLRDLATAVAAHGKVRRVVVTETRGSVPREAGAAMLVWEGGQSGTIGGGRLEWEAARQDTPGVRRHALGPAMGQCCGGAVVLHVSVWDKAALEGLDKSGGLAAHGVGPRPVGLGAEMARIAATGATLPRLFEGWLIETVAPARQPVTVWGAGHVGGALVGMLAPLPDLAVTWSDLPEKMPATAPEGVAAVPAADLPTLARHADPAAWHLIMTHGHDIDLALCNMLLSRGAGWIGLIGSETKWARFRSRLRSLGHTDAEISRIRCPIGDPALGKHPQAIALGVATGLVRDLSETPRRRIAG